MIKKLLITWGDHVYEMEEETQAQVMDRFKCSGLGGNFLKS